MKDIGVQKREYRKRSKAKMAAVAAPTSIANETLHSWRKGTKRGSKADCYKLKADGHKMETNLEERAFETKSQVQATSRLSLRYNRPLPLQTYGKATAGSVIFSNEGPELIVDRINASFLGAVDGVVEINDDSMEPTFCTGYRVAITRLPDNWILFSGQYYYIIDTNWQGFIRRVYQGEKDNSVRLVADNPDQLKFPPIERTLDQITAIFKVGAAIIKF